jgi:hypothetical protein
LKDLLTVLLPIVTAFLGAGLGYWAERGRWKRQVQREDANRMWQARSELYVDLIGLTLYKGREEADEEQLERKLEDIAGRVHVFSSDDIEGVFDTLIFNARTLPFSSEDERYNRAERIGMAISDLVGIARDEIQGRKYKRPRFDRIRQRLMGRRRHREWLHRRNTRKPISG